MAIRVKVGEPIPDEWRRYAAMRASLINGHVCAAGRKAKRTGLGSDDAQNGAIIREFGLLPGIVEAGQLVTDPRFSSDCAAAFTEGDWWVGTIHRVPNLQRLAALGHAASHKARVVRRFVCDNRRAGPKAPACNTVLGVIAVNGDHKVIAALRPRAVSQAARAAQDVAECLNAEVVDHETIKRLHESERTHPDGHEIPFDAWPLNIPSEDETFVMSCNLHGRVTIEMGMVRGLAEDSQNPDVGLPCIWSPR